MMEDKRHYMNFMHFKHEKEAEFSNNIQNILLHLHRY